jgi:flagellar protein FliS
MLEIAVSRYKQVVASTSTPGELLLALYGGLFRFLRTAKRALEDGKKPAGRQLISKAHAIIAELDLALDHDVAPDLCRNLSAIYGFCIERLMFASRSATAAPIDEVIRVLTPLHEAWQVAVPAAVREQGQAEAARAKAR